jgi:lipopolysaccharide biosynthesis glycosyltransferase
VEFIYCIDKNFNNQLSASIYSLLNNVDEDINITILHDTPESFIDYKIQLEKLSFCRQIKIIQIELGETSFPNLSNSHVSKATYFRLFITQHIKGDEVLIYLDADTIVFKNPMTLLKSEIDKLSKSRNFISACIETDKIHNSDIFERLKLVSTDYFNAGVMLLDNSKFKDYNLTSQLLEEMSDLNEAIKYWDQDVLNKYFDTNIEILDHRLNCKIDDDSPRVNLQSDPYILHYAGSKKPWTIEGLTDIDSHYFQNNYLLANNKKFYYMSTNWRLGTLKLLLKKICTFSIFNSKNYIKIIVSSLLLLTRRRVK